MKKSFILVALLLTIICLSIPEKNNGIRACDIIIVQDSSQAKIITTTKPVKVKHKTDKYNFYKNPLIFSIIQQ